MKYIRVNDLITVDQITPSTVLRAVSSFNASKALQRLFDNIEKYIQDHTFAKLEIVYQAIQRDIDNGLLSIDHKTSVVKLTTAGMDYLRANDRNIK